MGAVLNRNKSKSSLGLVCCTLAICLAGELMGGARAQVTPPPGMPGSTYQENSPDVSTAAMVNTMDALNDDRKLTAGDRVSYRVVEEQKDPVSLNVTDAGELAIPLVGLFPAAGKTCKEVAEELKPILEKNYFYKATVIIGLDTQSTRSLGKIYIMGQVHQQGAIELPPNEPLTVSQAVLLNGGLADFADKHRVKLIRKNAQGVAVTTTVDIEAVYRGRSDKDPVLQPGDTINVPEKLINF